MKQSAVLCLFVVAMSTFLAKDTHAANILLVPMNCNSHLMFFSRLGIDLAKLGHVTTLLAPSSARVPDFVTGGALGNFSFVKYPVDKETPLLNSRITSERMITMAMTGSPLRYMQLIREYNEDLMRDSEQDCTRLLDNVQLMRQVCEKRYDFAIMDPTSAVACYYTIPLSLGIPYASLSLGYLTAGLFRVPRLASFPNFVSVHDKPTFFERLGSFLVERMDPGFFTDNRYFMEKYAPEHPYMSTVEMLSRQSLWFYLEHLSINYPLPHMPNTVAVGDIMAGAKERPLSGEIKEFVSKSKRGVAIAVFGSFCDFFPPAITQQLCDAFTEATKRFGLSVIWKLNAEGFCRNDNILVSKWIPQYDLLADSRVKLFISHGGYSSIMESVYHAKPLIVFPIGLDQPLNAQSAESKGYAIRMNFFDFSTEMLVSNIGKLLTDPTYKRNAQLASAILLDRRDTAAERVSAMVDHVIKYGDRHLRTAAFELSTLEFLMFDIFAALVAAGAVGLSCVILCCCCVYRRCCRRRNDHENVNRSDILDKFRREAYTLRTLNV